jgi:hypothetical protein
MQVIGVGRGAVSGVRALVVVVLLSVGLVAAAAAPASAEGPTVVVTTETVTDGGLGTVEISGFPSGYSALFTCAADAVDHLDTAWERCALVTVLALPGVPPPTAQWTVTSTFTTWLGGRQVNCRTDVGGCVVGVLSYDQRIDQTSPQAAAFDDLDFGPTLLGTPVRQLTDGGTVAVSGTDLPAGARSVAQCARAFLDHPTPAQAAALCAEPTPVTPDAGGNFTTDLVVHDPFTPDGGGDPRTCGAPDCVIVLASADQPVEISFGISFGPTVLTLSPDHDLADGSILTATIAGGPTGPLHVSQCALPLQGPVPGNESCSTIGSSVTVDDDGRGVAIVASVTPLVLANGSAVDCRTDPCAFVAMRDVTQPVVQSAPLAFGPPPTLTVTPSSGLLDGQDMTVTVDHLVPEAEYVVQRCADESCDDGLFLPTLADGTLTATVDAAQRIGDGPQSGYCRAQCTVKVSRGTSQPLSAPFTMAAGRLSASPATGLTDGQTVQVTGTDLMPSYAGPTLWIFPTGGWAVTQCDRAILDDATLGGVLTHCSTAPVTRGVTVDGSTLATTIDVRASVTKVLGGTTDCTAAPGTCVVGLVRLEQDGSVSTHLAPVAFG